MNYSPTLHEQSWIQIINLLLDQNQPTTDAMAKNLKMQLGEGVADSEAEPGKSAVGLAGLPGAGKSFAAERLADMTDGAVISMGDAIRAEYEKRFYESAGDSSELGDFAAAARDEDAAQIPGWVTDLVETKETDFIVVDGVRSVTDWRVLNDYFDHFTLVWVESTFYTRLDRITERGREGEASFGPYDLWERDHHEYWNLGVADLVGFQRCNIPEGVPESEYDLSGQGLVDVIIENMGEDLTGALANLALEAPGAPFPE